jgi:Mg-chelatase subunit ChlD
MSFLAPLSLLWLALIAPMIILLYLLKLRRREVEVSSVYLWRQVIRDVQANAPLQKLRKNLLLLLQLLLLTALIVAVARPFLTVRALGGENVIVILDGSASMQSRDEGGSRFDAARRAARKMVDGMGRGDAMMVVLATARTRVLAPFTSDRSELRAALDRARPGDTATNLRDALALSISAGRSRRAQRSDTNQIYILSDGAFEALDDLSTEGVRIDFLKFGRRAENVGIVAMDVRRSFAEGQTVQAFVAIHNAGAQSRTCVLSLLRDDQLVDAREVRIPARGNTAEVIPVPRGDRGLLEARIDLRDDLDVDNVAYAQLAPRREVNVLLVSAGNFFLEKALVLDPDVNVTRVSPGGYAGQSGYDVVIFDRCAPGDRPPTTDDRRPTTEAMSRGGPLGPGNLLYVGASGAGSPVAVTGRATHPTILDVKAHPVTRFVSFPNALAIERALTARPLGWGMTLVEANTGPLVVAGEREGRRALYVGFDVDRGNSNLGLKVAFPIFVVGAVQWLAARPGSESGRQVRAGGVVPIDAPPEVALPSGSRGSLPALGRAGGGVRTVTVTDPDGRRFSVPVQGRTALFDATERRGIYTATIGKERRRFAVNLLSSAETDTRPADRIALGARTLGGNTQGVRTTREAWRWLAVLAVALLALEWLVYHRRV